MPTVARRMSVLVLLELVVCSGAIQQAQASSPGDFKVSLPAPSKKKEPINKVLGWQLSVQDDETPVTLGKIRGHGSLADWNLAHPDQTIATGDQVVEVNGVQWNSNSKEFADSIAKQFVASKERGEGLSLVLRRRVDDAQLSKPASLVDRGEQQQEGETGAAAAAEDSQKSTAAAEAEKSTAAAEEVARTAMKIEGLVSAWNKVHPEDGIDTTSKHFSDALAVLIRRATTVPSK
jgi:hypothetical protein